MSETSVSKCSHPLPTRSMPCCTFAQDQQLAEFNAREERVLEVGRRLMATWHPGRSQRLRLRLIAHFLRD